jgi:hypothetical protein
VTPRRFPAATDAALLPYRSQLRPVPDEPAENIDGGIQAAFDAGDPETHETVVDALGDMCWRKAHDGRTLSFVSSEPS